MKCPSYCCPTCGELIGWLGRIMPFHKCKEKQAKCQHEMLERFLEKEKNT